MKKEDIENVLTRLDPEKFKKEYLEEVPACPLCFGQTIIFGGHGMNTEYWVCSKWQEPGHLTEQEIKRKLHNARMWNNPSGRMA